MSMPLAFCHSASACHSKGKLVLITSRHSYPAADFKFKFQASVIQSAIDTSEEALGLVLEGQSPKPWMRPLSHRPNTPITRDLVDTVRQLCQAKYSERVNARWCNGSIHDLIVTLQVRKRRFPEEVKMLQIWWKSSHINPRCRCKMRSA